MGNLRKLRRVHEVGNGEAQPRGPEQVHGCRCRTRGQPVDCQDLGMALRIVRHDVIRRQDRLSGRTETCGLDGRQLRQGGDVQRRKRNVQPQPRRLLQPWRQQRVRGILGRRGGKRRGDVRPPGRRPVVPAGRGRVLRARARQQAGRVPHHRAPERRGRVRQSRPAVHPRDENHRRDVRGRRQAAHPGARVLHRLRPPASRQHVHIRRVGRPSRHATVHQMRRGVLEQLVGVVHVRRPLHDQRHPVAHARQPGRLQGRPGAAAYGNGDLRRLRGGLLRGVDEVGPLRHAHAARENGHAVLRVRRGRRPRLRVHRDRVLRQKVFEWRGRRRFGGGEHARRHDRDNVSPRERQLPRRAASKRRLVDLRPQHRRSRAALPEILSV